MYAVYNVRVIYTPTAYNKSDFSGGYKISATRQVNFLATLSKSFLDAHDFLSYNVIYPFIRLLLYLYFRRNIPKCIFFYFSLDEILNNAITKS